MFWSEPWSDFIHDLKFSATLPPVPCFVGSWRAEQGDIHAMLNHYNGREGDKKGKDSGYSAGTSDFNNTERQNRYYLI